MNAVEIASFGLIGMIPGYVSIAETGDFNLDGKSDILWRDTRTGAAGIWFMSGMQVEQSASLGTMPSSWTIQGLNAD
jgi:hypothetical protein